jgi:hypothetical protein
MKPLACDPKRSRECPRSYSLVITTIITAARSITSMRSHHNSGAAENQRSPKTALNKRPQDRRVDR